MEESRYAAAQMVAGTIQDHFLRHLQNAQAAAEPNLAPAPDKQAIELMIDAAFWSSLRREEGYSPKISLAFFPPNLCPNPILFEHRFELKPETLTKLSPGVERAGVYLGVWNDENGLYIWGTTFKIPNICFVLDVSSPGLLVIKHKRIHGFGKFTNVAVLNGDQIKIVDEYNSAVPYCPDMLKFLLGNSSSGNNSVNVMIQLAVSMRSHHKGGILLIVPSDDEAWKDSIIHPMKYGLSPYYKGMCELMQQSEDQRNESVWLSALKNELESLAGLTAIDGATVINDRYEWIAFGAKIKRASGCLPVEQIFFHEPVVGGTASVVNAAHHGGTRHLSAAQFVHDQRNAIALVASQDGNFTIFTWLPSEDMVQAYRIDTLLL